ncbi:DUF721 domain-containing protein [Sphaerochaeta sp. PS]|uniref:DUF721 domain-containing protein n=1 Tax=Sphaerochaeta sp. PS TaxID=3076336 RepID=UPI0028A42492|nr:DUF721 domain-containing protein [Sphaerochaeta sp. PS]MDT4762455.1 DUF721 domain-containing protein [Sphaerochaeta sp. PS]
MKDKRNRICKDGEPIEGKKVLDMVLRRLDIRPENPKASIGLNWQEIIGTRLYPHVKIIDIKGSTLVLKADHPSWAQITMMQQKKILALVQRKYPSLGVKSLQILSV